MMWTVSISPECFSFPFLLNTLLLQTQYTLQYRNLLINTPPVPIHTSYHPSWASRASTTVFASRGSSNASCASSNSSRPQCKQDTPVPPTFPLSTVPTTFPSSSLKAPTNTPSLPFHSSLGLFSERLYHVYRLVQRTRASAGGVETVLALATAYTLSELALNLCLKKRGMPNFLRWLLVLCDILFIGGFIAVAYETRPHGGLSSLCATPNQRQDPANRGNPLCSLTEATFALAIFST